MNIQRIAQWVGVGILVATIGGLLGWYVFISGASRSLDTANTGRGFSEPTPTFSAQGGSMRQNFVTFFDTTLRTIITGQTASSTQETTAVAPQLWLVSSVPSTGPAVFTKTIGTSSVEMLHFVERPSGNVFEVPLSGGTPTRVTNTLIPRVYEAVWLDNDSLVIRHADEGGLTVRSLLGNIVSASSSDDLYAIAGAYLDADVHAVASNPTHKEPSLLYLLSGKKGTFAIQSTSNAKEPKRVWSSALSDWRMSWLTGDAVLLWQKAAEGIVGSAYTLSLKSGETRLLVGNKNGLSIAKHPTEDSFVYSTSVNGKTTLYAHTAGVTRELPIVTFGEKCVWPQKDDSVVYCAVPRVFPRISLPDAWYRGEVSLSDRWFAVNPREGIATLMVDPADTSLDVLDPVINASSTHIFFSDSKSGTLWVLRI